MTRRPQKSEEETPEPERQAVPFRFEELPQRLFENVARLGWKEPMPVQEQVIPLMASGRDLVVQSRTGSGKTGAFVLPLLLRVDPADDRLQALILVPTRELAEQVHGVVRELAEGTGVRSAPVYGGVGYGPQLEAFQNKVQVVVATPGRMIDHLGSGRVSLAGLKLFILDEADEMLSLGFYPSIMKILTFLPERRQTALFSATILPGVAALAARFTRNPEYLSLSSDILHVDTVDHVYYVVDGMQKDRTLLKLIELENPEAALVFCNTKREVEYLGTFLKNFGYDGDYLSGDLTQAERDRVMARIRQGRLRFLVATDVAARGIDISALSHVFLYNLPQAHEQYIHRAGRTGRAGGGGLVISLVTILEEMELKDRARRFGLRLLRKETPSDEQLDRKVAERLRVMLQERYRGLSRLERERLGRFLPLARRLSESGEALDVVAMLFDQFYQETLHKPLYPHEEPGEAAAPAKEKVVRPPGRRGRESRPRRRRG